MTETIDENITELTEEEIKRNRIKKRVRFLVIYLVLATINVLIGYQFSDRFFYLQDGNHIGMFFLGTLIWGFILSLLFSLIPSKNSTYKTRYLNVALLIAVILNGWFIFMALFYLLAGIK